MTTGSKRKSNSKSEGVDGDARAFAPGEASAAFLAAESTRMVEESVRLEDLGRVDEALAVSHRACQLAKASDDVDALVNAEFMHSRHLQMSNQIEKSIALQFRTAERVNQCRDKSLPSRIYASLGADLVESGEIGRGFDLLVEALKMARPFGPSALYLPTTYFAASRTVCGFYDEAIQLYRESFSFLEQIGPEHDYAEYRFCFQTARYSSTILSRIFFRGDLSGAGSRRELEEIERLLVEALPRSERHVQSFQMEFTLLLMLTRILLGRTICSVELNSVIPLVRDLHPRGTDNYHDVFHLAEVISSHLGNFDLAREIMASFKAPSEKDYINWHLQWFKCMATVERAAGSKDKAIEYYSAYIREQEISQRRTIEFQISVAGRLGDLERARRTAKTAEAKAMKLQRFNEALVSERQMLEISAKTDPLTGLGNRRRLKEEVSRIAHDAASAPRTIAMVDIDHFKRINDQFSHQIGDRVLARLAEVLTHTVRPSDTVVRWGGEEFLVLFNSAVGADRIERIRRAIEVEDWEQVAPGLAVTASIGCVVWSLPANFEDALKIADERLYQAKRDGRNRCVVA